MREKEVCTLWRMLDLSATKMRDFIKTAPNSYILFLCEWFLNAVNGNVPANKFFLQNHKNEFEIYWSFVLPLFKLEKCTLKNLYYLPSDCLSPSKQQKLRYLTNQCVNKKQLSYLFFKETNRLTRKNQHKNWEQLNL